MRSLSLSVTNVYNFVVPDSMTEEDARAFLSSRQSREMRDACETVEESLVLAPPANAQNFGAVWVEFDGAEAARWGWEIEEGDEWLTGPDEEWLPIAGMPVEPPLPGMEMPRVFPPWPLFRRMLPAEQAPEDARVIYWAPMPSLRGGGVRDGFRLVFEGLNLLGQRFRPASSILLVEQDGECLKIPTDGDP